MPLCTGDPETKGVWVCPYCQPCPKPISCYSLQDVDPYNPAKGKIKVPCSEPCTRAGFHATDPGVFWQHVAESHGWDCRKLAEEPPRLLDQLPSAPLPRPPVQIQRGPSKDVRAKARAKRKKKKKRRR